MSTSSERIPLSKKQRFDIFNRDAFTCRYCGKTPPQVMLVVDHIIPVVSGGTNDQSNLATSCEECNQGKGKTTLKDGSMPEPLALAIVQSRMEEEREASIALKAIEARRNMAHALVTYFETSIGIEVRMKSTGTSLCMLQDEFGVNTVI